MRRALAGALGWLAISAASAACAGDETQGFKLSDHECWGVSPVTVRIGPETFGRDWKPFTAWVPGPAPACSYAITMSPDAGFVDDGDLCIARFELVLHPPRVIPVFQPAVMVHWLTPACRKIAFGTPAFTGGIPPPDAVTIPID